MYLQFHYFNKTYTCYINNKYFLYNKGIKVYNEQHKRKSFLEEIKSRRSLQKLIDSARFAPSCKNAQITRYTIVDNKDKLNEISQNCVIGFTFIAKRIFRCSALAVESSVCKTRGYKENGKFSTSLETHCQSFDVSIATQTFFSCSR